jgi:hypothetical protein
MVCAKKGLAKKTRHQTFSRQDEPACAAGFTKDSQGCSPLGECWHAVGTLLVEGWENRPTRADIFEDTSLAGTGRHPGSQPPAGPQQEHPFQIPREPSLHRETTKNYQVVHSGELAQKNQIKPVFSKKKPFLSRLAASFQFLHQLENPFCYSFCQLLYFSSFSETKERIKGEPRGFGSLARPPRRGPARWSRVGYTDGLRYRANDRIAGRRYDGFFGCQSLERTAVFR